MMIELKVLLASIFESDGPSLPILLTTTSGWFTRLVLLPVTTSKVHYNQLGDQTHCYYCTEE
jgi:hypothetical protein